MLKTGRYDQKIKFKEYGIVSDGAGGYIPAENPTIVLSTFARINQIKQSWNIEQLQKGLPSTWRVGVMVRKGFDPNIGMVVEWKGEDYQIITSPVIESIRMGQEWTFDITRNG